MTWHLPTQIYTMPSVVDVTGESPSDYSSGHFVSQSEFMFPSQSLDQQDPLGGRYSASSFPCLPPGPEVPGYSQQQYASTSGGQHHGYRETGFVWIGTNNYYPPSTYDQRYSENSFNPQRQSLRRHAGADRIEKSSSRKRRAPTVAQRRAANIRERRRMYNLNEAFDCLRQRIPTFAYEKRLSRIETLRLAISYISFMARIVKGEDPSTLRVSSLDSPRLSTTSQTTLRHAGGISLQDDDYDQDDDDDEDDGGEDDASDVDGDVIDEDSQDGYNEDIKIAPRGDSHSRT